MHDVRTAGQGRGLAASRVTSGPSGQVDRTGLRVLWRTPTRSALPDTRPYALLRKQLQSWAGQWWTPQTSRAD
jgi:hypothetical protein